MSLSRNQKWFKIGFILPFYSAMSFATVLGALHCLCPFSPGERCLF